MPDTLTTKEQGLPFLLHWHVLEAAGWTQAGRKHLGLLFFGRNSVTDETYSHILSNLCVMLLGMSVQCVASAWSCGMHCLPPVPNVTSLRWALKPWEAGFHFHSEFPVTFEFFLATAACLGLCIFLMSPPHCRTRSLSQSGCGAAVITLGGLWGDQLGCGPGEKGSFFWKYPIQRWQRRCWSIRWGLTGPPLLAGSTTLSHLPPPPLTHRSCFCHRTNSKTSSYSEQIK